MNLLTEHPLRKSKQDKQADIDTGGLSSYKLKLYAKFYMQNFICKDRQY